MIFPDWLSDIYEDHLSRVWRRTAQSAEATSRQLEQEALLRILEPYRLKVMDADQDMDERRRQLFLGVMAGLKTKFSGWIDFAQRLPGLDLQLIFEAAGVEFNTKDSTGTNALSGWGKTREGPEIDLNPLVKGLLMNLTLLHELFHLTHPMGLGHELGDTPLEISANLFALEILRPGPAAQNLLTTNVHLRLIKADAVIRHSSREQLSFMSSGSGR